MATTRIGGSKFYAVSGALVLALGGAGLVACAQGMDGTTGATGTAGKDASSQTGQSDNGDDDDSGSVGNGDDDGQGDATLFGDANADDASTSTDATLTNDADSEDASTSGDDSATDLDAGASDASDGSSTITDGGGSTGNDAGDASTCKKVLHIPDAGAANYCFGTSCSSPTGTCCDVESSSGKFTDTCVADMTACVAPDGGRADAYECDQPADCTTGKCYLRAVDTFDGGSRLSADGCGTIASVVGSVCTTTPLHSDLRVCTSNSDCTAAGTTCQASIANGKFFGTCR